MKCSLKVIATDSGYEKSVKMASFCEVKKTTTTEQTKINRVQFFSSFNVKLQKKWKIIRNFCEITKRLKKRCIDVSAQIELLMNKISFYNKNIF